VPSQDQISPLFDDIAAVIFDLDGVITDTASVHTAAWTQLFNEYLQQKAESDGTTFVPFTSDDYVAYVDGKLRYDGVKSFLESRDIHLPYGEPSDGADAETVCGLGNRKNEMFRRALDENGADVFPTSVTLVERLRSMSVKTGCVSSSKNCRLILESVDLLASFDAIIDGLEAESRGIPGKPAPDTYLECARLLGVEARAAAVVEDAISGVASGAAGGFGQVIGVNRGAGRSELLAAGATVVVDDLGELLL
jgi:beta-phosphoglucomutase family hydrolase